jgi:hypothetical protein
MTAGRLPQLLPTTCVSPNGRIDGHGVYVRVHPTTRERTCAFCGEVVS